MLESEQRQSLGGALTDRVLGISIEGLPPCGGAVRGGRPLCPLRGAAPGRPGGLATQGFTRNESQSGEKRRRSVSSVSCSKSQRLFGSEIGFVEAAEMK